MISFVTFFLLFLLPFIIAPFGITQFENPKVIVAEASIIVLFLFAFLRNPKLFYQKNSLIFLYGIIIFLTLIDLIFFRTSVSFFGNAFRMQGIFLLWLLLLFSYLSRNIQLKKIPWFVIIILLIAQVVATFFLPLNESQRYVGVMGEPNATAALMLFLWPFLWFSFEKNTWWKVAIMCVAALCIGVIFYLTNSRSAMIGFVIQVIFLLLLWWKKNLKQTVVICCCLLVATYSLTWFQKDVLYENRLEVWTAGVDAGLQSPIIGGGFGNAEVLLHKTSVDQHLRIRDYYVDSSHNIFLDWWVQAGIIGFIILFLLVFTTFKQFIKQNNQRNIVLLLGILTALSFNPASVVGLLQFWWLIGVSQVER